MPTYFTVLAWAVMLPLAIGTVGYALFRIFHRNSTSVQRWNAGIVLLVSAYLIGQWTKNAVFGPAFIRWHLADFGFPAVVGLLILPGMWQAFRFMKSPRELAKYSYAQQAYYRAKVSRRAMPVAVALSIMWELVEGSIFWTHPEAVGKTIAGTFDWIDIAAYVLGGALAFLCAHKVVVYAGARVDAEIERERQREQDLLKRRQAASRAAAKQRRFVEGRRRRPRRRK